MSDPKVDKVSHDRDDKCGKGGTQGEACIGKGGSYIPRYYRGRSFRTVGNA